MKYKKGYKYQLYESESFQTEFRPAKDLSSPSGYIQLKRNGLLVVKKGYAWDGPSGPSIDTKTFMRASLFHDAGYQLLREGVLTANHKVYIDKKMREICLEDGMIYFRAFYAYRAVKRFGYSSSKKGATKPVLVAP